MLTDLIQIKRLGEQKRGENELFRRFLKVHNYNERKFRKTAQEIEEDIDCRQCANCCRVATTSLQQRDIEKLTKFFGISRDEFRKQYTAADPETGEPILRRTEAGCVFLDGNDCSVYEVRPATCVDFPHLIRGRGPITTRMWAAIDRATYCPITYNALEAFKEQTKFRR
ncbi:MAG: YkgJ family cysteine cluster protein [Acidobacteria bacterium]|nr:YkgJ family cysteine cluster protein [Acidobacteriota bacterium]